MTYTKKHTAQRRSAPKRGGVKKPSSTKYKRGSSSWYGSRT